MDENSRPKVGEDFRQRIYHLHRNQHENGIHQISFWEPIGADDTEYWLQEKPVHAKPVCAKKPDQSTESHDEVDMSTLEGKESYFSN